VAGDGTSIRKYCMVDLLFTGTLINFTTNGSKAWLLCLSVRSKVKT
jgi:hypothetical protein